MARSPVVGCVLGVGLCVLIVLKLLQRVGGAEFMRAVLRRPVLQPHLETSGRIWKMGGKRGDGWRWGGERRDGGGRRGKGV